jgi:para-aminobenzoate synthetase component 1
MTAKPANAYINGMLPLVEELTPLPSAWHVFERAAHLPYPLFLDSALQDPHIGRFSFVAADPFEFIVAAGRHTRLQNEGEIAASNDPFQVLAEYLKQFQAEPAAGLPPFQGGAAGLFGYDLAHHLECLPRPRFDEFQVPDLAIGLYDCVIAFDHQARRGWLISTGFPETEPSARRKRAAGRLREFKQLLALAPAADFLPAPCEAVQPGHFHYAVPEHPGLFSNFDRSSYLTAVRRAIEYVHAGDCFQVNLAQRLLLPLREPALELYGRLRQCNPATCAGYFDLGRFKIASASPERFLQLTGVGQQHPDVIETRPIKGTRPRGQTEAQDRTYREQLLHSPKDRAENIMIVDLLRNDLGRVCRYGSVGVEAVCRLESYPFVHHLVSVVRGKLRPGLNAIDLLRAAFPGGSVTGAPKIRAMQIIAELEPTARGPYCGSLGYIGFDGAMDTNILIRTFTIGKGWIQFPVGGGIVADSNPEHEYEETWHKAAGLLRACS